MEVRESGSEREREACVDEAREAECARAEDSGLVTSHEHDSPLSSLFHHLQVETTTLQLSFGAGVTHFSQREREREREMHDE